jgi:hypothetical protein
MPQSNVIFFYLFAAFFIFITLRGELRKYMGFLLSTPVASGPQVVRGPDLPNISQVAQVAAISGG